MEEDQSEPDITARLRKHGIVIWRAVDNPNNDQWFAQFVNITREAQGEQIDQIGPMSPDQIGDAVIGWFIDRYEEADNDRKHAWLQMRELQGYAAYPKNEPIYDDQPPGPFADLLG